MIRKYNLFAESYKQRELGNHSEPELQQLFSLKPAYDGHRYNLQRTNLDAAVFVTTADGDIPQSYVTIVYCNQ